MTQEASFRGSAAPHWLMFAVWLTPVVTGLLLPAQQDPQAYQHFADTRGCFGVPNCLDVLSNAAFVLLALAGIATTLRGGARMFIDASERWIYVALFTATLLTGFGSAYFHWAPDAWRLVWDRLPLAVLFMCLLAATIAERVDARLSVRWLVALIALGLGTVLYWRWGMQSGAGNILPYAMVQYGGIAAMLALALTRASRYTRGHDIFIVGMWYGLAKLGEMFDHVIFDFTGFVSGHTLKHLCAALAIYWVLRSLRLRQPVV